MSAYADRQVGQVLRSLPREDSSVNGSGRNGHVLEVKSVGPAGGALESGRKEGHQSDSKAPS